jgi:hypothetical protein
MQSAQQAQVMIGMLFSDDGLPEFSIEQMMYMYCYPFLLVVQIAHCAFVMVVRAYLFCFLTPCVGSQIVIVGSCHICTVPAPLLCTAAFFEFLAATAATWLVAVFTSSEHSISYWLHVW